MSSIALQVAEYELNQKSAKTDDISSSSPALKHVLKKILWDAKGKGSEQTEFETLQDWIIIKLEKFGFVVSRENAPYRVAKWIVSWRVPFVVVTTSTYFDESEVDYELQASLLGSSPPSGIFLNEKIASKAPLMTTACAACAACEPV